MTDLPSGTVTFLFTDIEGSTALWERDPTAMRPAVDRHFALLHEAITAHHGVLFKTVGDALHAAFGSAAAAVAAAVDAQQALHAEPWALAEPLRVRMALHTGEATPTDGDYAAPVLNRLSRLLAVGHGGQVLLSAATHQLVHDALPPGTELHDHGEHRLRDLQPARLYQLVAPELPTAFPPLRTLEHHPNNLPAPLTSFVGREQEIASVRALLTDDAVRLVTLTGPGGVGKTRLAVRVAAGLLETFPDGLFFVGLAPVRDPSLVASTIAKVLGLREEGPLPLPERLAAFLRERRLLLILDNFEPLLEAAPLVSELLTQAPGLTVLATSRTRLRLQGEREVVIAPLKTPDADHRATTPEEVGVYDAVRLFVARAQEAQPGFALTVDNAGTVAAICARLDGLPLALELAAARVKLLSPQALLSRLDKRLPLLTGGARDLPTRQQTLRATIAWSYDLLTATEQALFRRLSVFVGGFDFDSVTAVATGDDLDADTLEGIASLVDHNLLRRLGSADQEPRLGMPELLGEFGLERLVASGEEEVTRNAHAAHFLATAKAELPRLEGSERPAALAWAKREHHNLRAAMDWAVTQDDAETAQGLAWLLGPFWYPLGFIAEGRDCLNRVTAMTGCSTLATRVNAYYCAAAFAIFQDDHAVVEPLAAEALRLSQEGGYRAGIARSLLMLGAAARSGDDFVRATTLQEEALALFRELDEPIWGEGVALGLLGETAFAQGDLDRSVAWHEEALAVWRWMNHPSGVPASLTSLAHLARCRGEIAKAMALYQESLTRWRDQGERLLIAECLAGMAGVALAVGELEPAVRLFAATSQLEAAMGFMPTADERAEVERNLSAARQVLGSEAFAAAWAAGRALTLDAAITDALVIEIPLARPQ